jgi:hypothetical protein
MFDIGKLVWVWIKGEQPATGLVVEVLEGGFYNVLIEEQIHKLSDDRIWNNKDECIKPPPFFPKVQRMFPGLIANQIFTVQPMTVPSALPFYLDYTFPSGSKDEEDK